MIYYILITSLALLNFFYLVPPVVNWDEGTHALWGYRVFLALKDLNFNYFSDLIRSQFAYPPLGSLLIALFNLPFGFSISTTRFVSTIGFIFGGILFYKIFLLLPKKLPALSGGTNFSFVLFFTLLSFLTSPIILFYSVVVFKEVWGMSLTLLVIYLYFKAVAGKKTVSYIWVGLSLAVLFFWKYNYAGLLAIAFLVEGFVEIALGVWKKIYRWFWRQAMIFLPVVVFGGWWIFLPSNKLSWFLDIMRSDWNPVTVGLGGRVEYLTFFLQSIRVSYLFSDVIFFLVVIGFLMGFKDLVNKKIRFLMTFFLVNLVLGTAHAINLQDRYILTSMPALFLVAGYEWGWLASTQRVLSLSDFLKFLWRKKLLLEISKNHTRHPFSLRSFLQVRFIRIVFVLILITIFFYRKITLLPVYLKSNATHLLSSAMYNEKDYHDTIFNFNPNSWPKVFDGVVVGGKKYLVDREETPEGVIDFILDNIDVGKGLEIVGFTSEISPDWVELRRNLRLNLKKDDDKYHSDYDSYIAAIEVKPSSRLYTFDYKRANSWQLSRVIKMRVENKDDLIISREFKELGVVVDVYGVK